MPITRDDLSRPQRTRHYVSPLIDKSAGAAVAVIFASGSYSMRLTRLTLINIEDEATADADIDIGWVAKPGDATGDADGFNRTVGGVGYGFLLATRIAGITPSATPVIADVDAGEYTEEDMNIIVPAHTVVTMTHNAATGAGTYYAILEYEILDPNPTEV